MIFFVASEGFFFLALIIAYAFYSHPGGKLAETAQYLDFKKSAIYTLFLFSSSGTIAYAANRLKKGARGTLIAAIAATILLGVVFISGQGSEYSRLIHLDVTVSKNVFGSAFFTLTGFHGLHVIGGLILLLVCCFVIASGKYRKIETVLFESTSIYWHFVDIVWIFVFSTVYIGAII